MDIMCVLFVVNVIKLLCSLFALVDIIVLFFSFFFFSFWAGLGILVFFLGVGLLGVNTLKGTYCPIVFNTHLRNFIVAKFVPMGKKQSL